MRQSDGRITEAGARTVAVFMGAPQAVGRFCRERDLPYTCLADPDRSGYAAFGLQKGGPSKLLGPNVLVKGVKLLRKGIATGLPHPGQDVRQMPGTFVIARGGTVLLSHYHDDAADNPDTDVLLGALGAS